jgi:hypothetical protein
LLKNVLINSDAAAAAESDKTIERGSGVIKRSFTLTGSGVMPYFIMVCKWPVFNYGGIEVTLWLSIVELGLILGVS